MFKSLLVFSFLGTTFGGTVASADSNNQNLNQTNTGNAQTKGTLQLNEVPSLSFHSTENPSNDVLNTTNNENKLIVTDYRDHPGWTLNASITNVGPINGTPSSSIPSNDGDWKMNLNTKNITNSDDQSHAPVNNNSELDIDPHNSSTTNNSTILNTSSNNNGYGVNSVDFNSNNNTTLNVPNVKSGTYSMTMNWSLGATTDSGNTSTNS